MNVVPCGNDCALQRLKRGYIWGLAGNWSNEPWYDACLEARCIIILEVSIQLQINYSHKGENLFGTDVQRGRATQMCIRGTSVWGKYHYHHLNVLLLVAKSHPSIHQYNDKGTRDCPLRPFPFYSLLFFLLFFLDLHLLYPIKDKVGHSNLGCYLTRFESRASIFFWSTGLLVTCSFSVLHHFLNWLCRKSPGHMFIVFSIIPFLNLAWFIPHTTMDIRHVGRYNLPKDIVHTY